MHIRIGWKETRNIVYVLNNTSDFYLSESALKDLHLLPPHFPAQLTEGRKERPRAHAQAENLFKRCTILFLPKVPTGTINMRSIQVQSI